MPHKLQRIARILDAARDRRVSMRLAQMAAIVLGTSVASGCGTVAAVATAPITMPIMIIGARVNDGGPSIEELRKTSQWKAEEALMHALKHGTIGSSTTWTNPSDPQGPAWGRSTLLVQGRGAEGETCWRTRIESRTGDEPIEEKTETLCRVGRNGWRVVNE